MGAGVGGTSGPGCPPPGMGWSVCIISPLPSTILICKLDLPIAAAHGSMITRYSTHADAVGVKAKRRLLSTAVAAYTPVMNGSVGMALGLTLLAGLSTGIGNAIAYFIRRPKIVYLSFSLGLSAGVMIYVSFMELLPSAIRAIGEMGGVLGFFVGIVFIGLIDQLVPEVENPHSFEGLEEPRAPHEGRPPGAGVMTALAIGIHNFPEGMATFASVLADVHVGLFIAVAIAIHNIPEGIAVSVPIFYATSNRNKAFAYSFLSGISEPIGPWSATCSSCPS